MHMSEPEAPSLKKKKRRKSPFLPPDMRAHRRNAQNASEKLKTGQDLSETEIMSLFKADNVENEDLERIITQYGQSSSISLFSEFNWSRKKKQTEKQATIICPNVESELVAYFKKHPEQLYSITPRKFEEFVAAVFKNHGFDVELTPETRDGGVDIIAIHRSHLTGNTVNLVECKRYNPRNKVGIGIVQRLLGNVVQQQAHKGIVVTTSYFTVDAACVARESRNVLTLKDYLDILGWLRTLE